ncbi:MAG: hypothetical protein KDJ52_28475 [Anaerolineae bacterium]|nr:hypothetical protein [Anaerolineae bacterium]
MEQDANTEVRIEFDLSDTMAIMRLSSDDDSIITEIDEPLSNIISPDDLPAAEYVIGVQRLVWREMSGIEAIRDRVKGHTYQRVGQLLEEAEKINLQLSEIERQQRQVPPSGALDLAQIETMVDRVIALRKEALSEGGDNLVKGRVVIAQPLTGLTDEGYDAITRWLFDQVQRLEPALDYYDIEHGGGSGAVLVITEPDSEEIAIDGYDAEVRAIAKTCSYQALELSDLNALRVAHAALEGQVSHQHQKEWQSLGDRMEALIDEVGGRDPVVYSGTEAVAESKRRVNRLQRKLLK